MVMTPRPKVDPTPEVVAERERRRAILKYLAGRHHESLEILAAYDRGEIERPVARPNDAE